MNTIKFIAVAIGALLISANLFANDYSNHSDDTIRIKTKNNSELIIVVNELKDVDNLNAEIEAVMKSLDEVFSRLEDELDELDTVINISVRNIDKTIKVDIEGREGSEVRNVYFDVDVNPKTKKEKKFHIFGTYDLGFNNYLENGKFPNDVNAQYSVKPWGSWYISLGTGMRFYVAKPFSIDIATDIAWYNYKYQDRSTRVTKTDDDIIFSGDPTGADYHKSKTAVPYLNLSLTPLIHFGKKNTGVNHRMFRVGAGVYAGYRLGGRVKYVYSVNNHEIKYKNSGDYFLNTYRYGVKAVFGVNDINFFASYDLSTLYAANRGPELNPICFGLNWTF